MKQYIKAINVLVIAGFTLVLSGCKKLLEEHPQSSIVPSFFSTPAGVLGGIAGVYQSTRGLWGGEGFYAISSAGTDEVLHGELDNGYTDLFTYNGIASTDGNTSSLWNTAYGAINTLNGVLQYGNQVTGLDTATKRSYLAQAYFLRAFYYFYLVQTYGDVPLHVDYITTPSAADSRSPIADVYTQIISDLNLAVSGLQVSSPATSPDALHPFGGKAASQATALFLLGKVYLTRGYTAAGSAADFTQAASILSGLINNKSAYGADLWQDYAQAFYKANDYGKEVLLNCDRSTDPKYGGYTTQSNGFPGDNILAWYNRSNYSGTFKVNPVYSTPGVLAVPFATTGPNAMTRDVNNGRPYARFRPNIDIVTTGANAGKSYIYDWAFADRANDSRYDKTFQTVWISNTSGLTSTRGTLQVGVDTSFWIPPYEVPGAPTQRNGTDFKGIIVPPSLQRQQLTNNAYNPTVKKFDDSTRGTGTTNANNGSTRPVCIIRFAEAYLLCAEAFFNAGNLDSAAHYINIIRERAAFRSTNTDVQNAAAAAAMDVQPSDITLDFILDESTRELYGEGVRWLDLTRTGQLINRVKAWNPVEAGTLIDAHHALRPIPQTELDRITSGPAMHQNPGY
ncbi:MAG TPA: RagB/SusD family nutrient uptake outer membrane protein [Chitinophagaceae bacterium]